MLWLDIDDLLAHLEAHGRPSGIQRVVHEIGAALHRRIPDRVGFLRRGDGPFDFRIIPFERVEAAFAATMRPQDGPVSPVEADPQPAPVADDDEAPLPQGVARTAAQFGAAQAGSVVAIGRLALGSARLGVRGVRAIAARRRRADEPEIPPALAPDPVDDDPDFADRLRPGDVFLTLGSPWHHDSYARTVRWLRDERRVGFGLLIHDLVPIRHPQWCDRGVIRTFRDWHRAVLPMADHVFTLSQATAADVAAHLRAEAIDLPRGVAVIPPGLSGHLRAIPSAPPVVEKPYVLFVSTIEARKNHALLLRVWRRLLEERPPEAVPTLVFAGRAGWLVADLMQQLDNTGWLDGHIRFVEGPSDAELRRLYEDCLFTVFPSLFEGCGLPVIESLGLASPCVASDIAAVVEAGGGLARHFNPVDLSDACRVIGGTIDDPEGLAAWRARLGGAFRPPPWDAAARAIADACLGEASPGKASPGAGAG